MNALAAIPIAEAVSAIHEEGQGVFRLERIAPEDAWRLILLTYLGDAQAALRLRSIVACAEEILERQHDEPRLCLCCSNHVTTPIGAAFILLLPERDDAETCVAAALCEDCAGGDPDALKGLAVKAFRCWWPDLKSVEITHREGGRA